MHFLTLSFSSLFGAEIVAATKQEFLTRLKALTAARALTSGERVTKDECEELLYKIHAEQREKFFGRGDSSGAGTEDVGVVAKDADDSKEDETRRRPRVEKSSLTESLRPAQIKPRMGKSSLRPKNLSESIRTVKRANKSSKKEVHFDDRITWNEDEERGSSDNDSRREELSQLIELKLQLANQQALIDTLKEKLSSMSKVQERNNDLKRENYVLWKKVMALQSASKNQGRSAVDRVSLQGNERSTSKNQGISVVDKILSQSYGSTGTAETAPCSATSDIQSLYSELFLPDSVN